MKNRLIFLILIAWNCTNINSENPQGDVSFYSESTAFQDQIDQSIEQFIVEELRKEADYVKMKDGRMIEGDIEERHEEFLMIHPLLKDTLLKVYYMDIDRIEFYKEG